MVKEPNPPPSRRVANVRDGVATKTNSHQTTAATSSSTAEEEGLAVDCAAVRTR